MNYKKQINDNYTLHLINNDRFKTINVDVYFSSLYKREDVPYLNLLVKLLVHSSKKYNTKNKMSIALENLYNSNTLSKHAVIGKMENLLLSLEFINPIYTEEKMYDETLNFLHEIIFNPNIINQEFDNEIFNQSKENLIKEIKRSKENPSLLAYENFSKEMYKGSNASFGMFGNINDYESITSKDLYSFYKNLLKTFKIDIVIEGELEEDKIINKINKLFIKNNNNSITINDIYNKVNIKEKTLIKKEKFKFNQSHLLMGYKFDDITDYELNYVLTMYNTILGSMNNSILFTKVREENSYCYNISSSISKFNPSLVILSGINKKNYEGALKVIKDCIKLMSDEKIVSSLFNTAQKTINTYLNDYYDNPYSSMEHYYIKEFTNFDDIEEKRKIYENLKVEDVINLNKKIKLDTIYFLEGVNDESN